MADWDAGYVSDVEYIPGFYREQGPAHLDFICLLAGVEPPRRDRAFTYCELGCGRGDTALALAAANPRGIFHAVDFNPAHIARARETAERIGLDNITFHEASFEEMLGGAPGAGLPPFDYVTMHGVYSWVGAEARGDIVRFLAQAVKPGGVVYVSYNALPGWAAMMPVQRLMLEHARGLSVRSDRRAAEAAAFVETLHQAGAAALSDGDLTARLRRESTVHRTDEDFHAYLAHEYLNDHWEPLYHADVARAMSAAKLEYVGGADVFSNAPSLLFSDEQMGILAAAPSPAMRETLKDYISGQRFRSDVYVRGVRHLTPDQRNERLNTLRLALTVIPEAASPIGLRPEKGILLDEPACRAAFAALAGGTRTLAELLDLPEVRANGVPLDTALLSMILVGTNRAVPVPPPGPESDGALDSVLRHNGVRAGEYAQTRRPGVVFATTVGGTGIPVSDADLLLCIGLGGGVPADPTALVNHAYRHVLKDGPMLASDPVKLTEQAQARAALTQEIGIALHHGLPLLRRLGAL